MPLQKFIAIPVKFYNLQTGTLRDDLSEAEQTELQNYGLQDFSEADMAEHEALSDFYLSQQSKYIMAEFEGAIQLQLDAAAKAHGYDNINTAVSYAEEPAVEKFYLEGRAFRAWRSLVWAYAYEQLAAVLAGERAQPDVESFLLELPALQLPQ